MSKDERAKITAEFWDKHHKLEVSRDYWTCHPIINEYVNSIIAHGSNNILEWFVETYPKLIPFERGLSIGCGTGAADRQAIHAGLCRCIEGIDISQASIKVAKQEAQKAGLSDRLSYSVSDLNSLSLSRGYYDFALCVGSLHHVENLEHIFNELRTGLKPGAFILINEYVGPSRLQWTERQLKILNKAWEVMPHKYRRSGPISPVNKEELIKVDPSEAVRSSEITSLLFNSFEIVAHIEYGGSFLMPFWSQGLIPDIFLEKPSLDRQVIIKLLCLIDELLIEEKILPTCYAQFVARNNPATNDRPFCNTPQNINRKRWTDLWLYPTDVSSSINKKINSKLVKKAVHVLRTEGFISLLRATMRYLERFKQQK